MNKGNFIDSIAVKANVSKTTAASVFAAMEDTIAEAMKANDTITIPGFGKFEVVHKEATTSKSFGKTTKVPAKDLVKFRVSGKLKNLLND